MVSPPSVAITDSASAAAASYCPIYSSTLALKASAVNCVARPRSLLAGAFVIAVIVVSTSLLADLAYAVLDPKIRHA